MADKNADEITEIARLHRWIYAVGGNISLGESTLKSVEEVEGRRRAHHRAQEKEAEEDKQKCRPDLKARSAPPTGSAMIAVRRSSPHRVKAD